MDLGLKDKIALVMAGSKGLGKAVALKLSGEGALVSIISRNEENLEKAAYDIKIKTGKAPLVIQGDVTKQVNVEKAVKMTVEKFGTIHLLFTNAGGPPSGGFFDFTPEDYEKAVKLNLMSTIYGVYAAIPYMKKNRYGRIVASASMSVKQPLNNLILSNVSRAGVITFIKSVSNAVAPFNITANTVLPGYTMTDRVKSLIEKHAERERVTFEKISEEILKDIPIERMGTVEEFASTVCFLMSKQASYITGISLPIDGGYIKCI